MLVRAFRTFQLRPQEGGFNLQSFDAFDNVGQGTPYGHAIYGSIVGSAAPLFGSGVSGGPQFVVLPSARDSGNQVLGRERLGQHRLAREQLGRAIRHRKA